MVKKPRETPLRWEASIVDGILYFEDVRQAAVEDDAFREIITHEKAIRVVSLDYSWVQHVWIGDQLVKEDINVEMTLRSEIRAGTQYWYAYKRCYGKLHKRFVGQSDTINNKKLLDVARRMPGNLR